MLCQSDPAEYSTNRPSGKMKEKGPKQMQTKKRSRKSDFREKQKNNTYKKQKRCNGKRKQQVVFFFWALGGGRKSEEKHNKKGQPLFFFLLFRLPFFDLFFQLHCMCFLHVG